MELDELFEKARSKGLTGVTIWVRADKRIQVNTCENNAGWQCNSFDTFPNSLNGALEHFLATSGKPEAEEDFSDLLS